MSKYQYTGILSGLILLALAGNYLHVPLFFGVDFLFGSIFVILAVYILGMWAAVLTAVVAGLYTVNLWGHPYAMIVFSLEALVVGYVHRIGFKNLVLADMGFWFFLGAPLVWVFYSNVLR